MPPSPTRALERTLELLRCPTCRAGHLHLDRGALRCPEGHTFDIARHGYVGLLTGTRPRSGDDAAMVRSRERVLATGAYAPIRRTVVSLATRAVGGEGKGTLVDVGCGTGYYLAGVLDELPGARGLGLDTSARALRSAARAHERAAAATWDVFRPFPMADSVVDVVLDIFAPRNPAEFHRVLRAGGQLIVVRPTRRHLAELRAQVPGMVTVDGAKERRLRAAMDPHFEPITTERVEYAITLEGQQARDLVAMTPSARHVGQLDLMEDPPASERITISVLVTAYQRR